MHSEMYNRIAALAGVPSLQLRSTEEKRNNFFGGKPM